MTSRNGRASTQPWRGVYGVDDRYTGRVDRAKERGQFTEPGTAPNPRDEAKVSRKRKART